MIGFNLASSFTQVIRVDVAVLVFTQTRTAIQHAYVRNSAASRTFKIRSGNRRGYRAGRIIKNSLESEALNSAKCVLT